MAACAGTASRAAREWPRSRRSRGMDLSLRSPTIGLLRARRHRYGQFFVLRLSFFVRNVGPPPAGMAACAGTASRSAREWPRTLRSRGTGPLAALDDGGRPSRDKPGNGSHRRGLPVPAKPAFPRERSEGALPRMRPSASKRAVTGGRLRRDGRSGGNGLAHARERRPRFAHPDGSLAIARRTAEPAGPRERSAAPRRSRAVSTSAGSDRPGRSSRGCRRPDSARS
jgi:hypothetical protein